MANKEKTFNLKIYAVVAFFAVAAALVLIVTFTFKSRYIAFHPDEVARNYVDTIVQTGDGYDAYKTTLLSKSDKYGDYIRKYYMYPLIYREAGYKAGDDTKNLTGFNDEKYMSDKTKDDDGTLNGKLIDAMYDYYVELTADGWDNYDEIFTKYFAKLVEVRKEIFGDDYLTDEIMFTALEGNVRTYGESLTGTEDEFDENTGVQLKKKSQGAYQKAYGDNYKFTTVVDGETAVDLASYKASLNTEALEKSGVKADDIKAVKAYKISVKTEDGKVVTTANVTVAQIGSSWYVDNSATDTTSLYGFYK